MPEGNGSAGDRALDALCGLYGVSSTYIDIWGKTQHASAETKRALLRALGALDDGDADAALKAHEANTWRRVLPPVAVFRADKAPYRLLLHFDEAQQNAIYHWSFALENARTLTGDFRPCDLEITDRRQIGADRYIEVAFDWRERLATGYHRYSVSGPGLDADEWVSFIVGHSSCHIPPALDSAARTWGPAVQLYSLRSERNWGIGDFTDLRTLVEHWGHHGAGVVGTNPLHALYPHNPTHASPYSPSSRLFLNVLYIDVDSVVDARESPVVLAMTGSAHFHAALEAARTSEFVDYTAVARLKLQVLESAYAHFRESHVAAESERARAFRRFQAQGGERLHQHALFDALQERFHREDPSIWGWPAWPVAYRRPQNAEVLEFARSNTERIEFYEYLQWQAALQLGSADTRARELGYEVGLYQDLAISVDRGGAESWANQDVYAVGASVGAPPDEVNLKGQNWGLPPLRPQALRNARYEPYIATLRANMRYSGALRIDHVMGLFRLYWIPPGASAADGAYVSYPFDDLLTILALESHRNECMVIGEDLGTVPDEVRAGLARARVLSYRLLYFEREPDGEYKRPQQYPEDALVAVSTHDLATLAGFWEGHDLEVRHKLDLFPSEEVREQYIVNRAQERARLTLALEHEKLVPNDAVNPIASTMNSPLALAVHEYLARTPSRIFAVQLEDVLGLLEQANMPGTVEDHPNWRRKLPLKLEDIDRDARFLDLWNMLSRKRPSATATRRAPARVQARIPRCTYRLQLNADFNFPRATALIPFLARLGISHVYCSPYLKARPGSTHGYDITDHSALNPEIGTREDFDRFIAALADHGMGHVLDVVPNHMGVIGADNAWWLDVLEHGQASAYSSFFDIDWHPANAALDEKVLIPVLGDQYGLVLERGELGLSFSPETGEFSVRYYDHRFPVDPREYPLMLRAAEAHLRSASAPEHASAELAALCSAFAHLPPRSDTNVDRKLERRRNTEIYKSQLARLAAGHAQVSAAIANAVHSINAEIGKLPATARLHELLERQAYRLASWRVAADEINYRRFFDVNDLAALRMEDESVFEATHHFVLNLCAEGKIDGLRIDHPDGLYDPEQYFRRLQQRYAQLAGIELQASDGARPDRPLYVVVEKIAASHERLPENWAVYGTSGYRFATVVNNVLVDCSAAEEMEQIYRSFAPDAQDYPQSVYEGKRAIMDAGLAAPLMMLATELARIARADCRTRDYTLNNLRSALAEVVAFFPVYRTYIVDAPSAQDRRYIEWAVTQARRHSRAADTTIFDFLQRMLLAETPDDTDAELRARISTFAMKVQQFTAPVMAKGVEDTAFYRYHRLVSLNDVGGDPGQFGMPVSAFHGASAERSAHRPHTMLATSTHDNKRSEDVRARIDVLSEMPAEWKTLLRKWERMNRSKKSLVEGRLSPAPNDEFLLYQILLGSFSPGTTAEKALADYSARIEAYMVKALREAKVHTSWINPNAEYEDAVTGFVRAVLAPTSRNLFLKDLNVRSRPVAWYGALNSLSMTLLKLASPGVPDIYQGNEIHDFSLVDPDNRRPVDYVRRAQLVGELEALGESTRLGREVSGLAASLPDGKAKTWLILRALAYRSAEPDLFAHGGYIPLQSHGARSEHVVAFARRCGDRALLAIAGRLWLKLGTPEGELPVGEGTWGDTTVDAGPVSGTVHDLISGERVPVRESHIRLSEAFRHFPAALLVV